VKRVLLVAAHPDDEDTSLLATLARGMGVEAAYFSLTRGEGGQNLIGPELYEGLGIIRSGELLSARSVDGAGQFFSRAFDFGYSKTADETFGQWPREVLLSDLVWAIRKFRPQILVSVFSGTPNDGHGQHQAAGILTLAAWEAAGDPSRFPEQFARGVEPWTPLKLYRRTFFDPENATLAVPTGDLDPLLGRSYHQVAMDSRSRHRSQDFGTAQAPGPRQTHLTLLETRVPSGDDEPIFTGVDTTFAALFERPEAKREVERYRRAISLARLGLTAMSPASILPDLRDARESLEGILALANEGPDGAKLEAARRLRLIGTATHAVSGVRLELRSRSEILVPGQSALVEARLWSGADAELQATAPVLRIPDGWTVEPLPPEETGPEDDTGAFSRFFNQREEGSAHGVPVSIGPGDMALWRFRVTLPEGAKTTAPYYLARPRQGAIYDWVDDAVNRTLPFQSPLLSAQATFELRHGDVVLTSHAEGPIRYRGVDKAAGEFWRPVQVSPRLSVAPASPRLVWPVADNGAREVAFELEGFDASGVAGTVELSAPAGWRVSPGEVSFDLPDLGAEARVVFQVTPPSPAAEGEFELRPVVRTSTGAADGLRVTVIDYPHIEPHLTVESAAVRAVRFPVQVADRRIGYVMGSGDAGPEAIQQLGLELELIETTDWSAERLDRFDTIVLGVRAYEVRSDLIASNRLLLEWVERGGTLITQYNKFEFNDGDYAPFPIAVGRGRVTDENAAVELLHPESALLSGPNEIRASDFDGWVQERGLYYPAEWADAYTELLRMADPDEAPQTSSLLVAPHGEGLYVHTSLAFFRQLPAGVPGAYRLWANILSIDPRRWREATTS
jgi:LmbE family N-acetylglucosaminyl deacetylase